MLDNDFVEAKGKKPVASFLLQAQQAFYKIHIAFVNNAVFAERALAAFGFFCKDVTFERFLVSDLAGSSHFKALFCAGVCFNLRHFTWFFCLPLRCSRTGGTLIGPLQE
jgi:hypothetical protein